jgi:hypothetical protein
MVSELHRASDKDPSPICSTRLPLQQLANSDYASSPCLLSVVGRTGICIGFNPTNPMPHRSQPPGRGRCANVLSRSGTDHRMLSEYSASQTPRGVLRLRTAVLRGSGEPRCGEAVSVEGLACCHGDDSEETGRCSLRFPLGFAWVSFGFPSLARRKFGSGPASSPGLCHVLMALFWALVA